MLSALSKSSIQYKPLSDFIINILRRLNSLLILITFGAYLAPYISPHTTWFFAVLGLFYPILLFANLVFLFFWLWQRKWLFLYSFGCILMGWTHFTGLMGFNLSQAQSKNPLTVVSYNTRSFSKLFPNKKDNSKEQQAFKKRWQSELGEVEILCLQEFHAHKERVEKIKTLLKLPNFIKHKTSGTAIFSKYPILKQGEIQFKKTGNSCLWADLNVKGKTARVYSVHLESVKISADATHLRENSDLRDKETWRGFRKILGKYRRSTNTRVTQTQAVTAHIAQTKHPVILTGDFNDTPISYVYRQMSQGLCDNFKEAGRGFGATYAGSIPMLRIDYILTDPYKFKVYKHGILKEKYSDHYPVFSQLELL